MIDKRKNFLIELLLKNGKMLDFPGQHLDFYFKWCGETYNVSDEKILELKKEYNIEEYTKRIIVVMDKYFSVKELQLILQFYASDVGKKLLDNIFMKEMGEVMRNMEEQLEKAFSINNNK